MSFNVLGVIFPSKQVEFTSLEEFISTQASGKAKEETRREAKGKPKEKPK